MVSHTQPLHPWPTTMSACMELSGSALSEGCVVGDAPHLQEFERVLVRTLSPYSRWGTLVVLPEGRTIRVYPRIGLLRSTPRMRMTRLTAHNSHGARHAHVSQRMHNFCLSLCCRWLQLRLHGGKGVCRNSRLELPDLPAQSWRARVSKGWL